MRFWDWLYSGPVNPVKLAVRYIIFTVVWGSSAVFWLWVLT